MSSQGMSTPGMTRPAQLQDVAAIVVGASAGGIHAMMQICKDLPTNYPLPIIVTLHMQDMRDSRLAALFQHHLRLRVKDAEDKESIRPGILYFAVPGYHLSIERERVFSFSCEPPLHFSRPSIDILMESAVDAYGANLMGILMTGANQDGAAGLLAIKQAGGICVVQDPAEAEIDYMPKSALALQTPDLILTLAEINALLISLGDHHVH